MQAKYSKFSQLYASLFVQEMCKISQIHFEFSITFFSFWVGNQSAAIAGISISSSFPVPAGKVIQISHLYALLFPEALCKFLQIHF